MSSDDRYTHDHYLADYLDDTLDDSGAVHHLADSLDAATRALDVVARLLDQLHDDDGGAIAGGAFRDVAGLAAADAADAAQLVAFLAAYVRRDHH